MSNPVHGDTLARRPVPAPVPAPAAPPKGGEPAAPLLHAQGLVRRFGALTAIDGVTLSVMPGEIHALIGPNGAGKSTLIHLLSGQLRPDAGTLRLMGRDVTRRGQAARVKAGLSRSFQVSNLFAEFSVRENLRLALQACRPERCGIWRRRAGDLALDEAAQKLAADCTLDAGLLDLPAGTLPHGEQRKLEFAMALASGPRVLLLDEPMAGMGPDETLRLTELIKAMRGRFGMLLVEHDMQAVFALADRVSVLVAGRVIATGAPAAIRANLEVQRAYLGEATDGAPVKGPWA